MAEEPKADPNAGIGPLMSADDTVWFSVGVRWDREHPGSHYLAVTCSHCLTEQTFSTAGYQRTSEEFRPAPKHIGEWMINHRRRHR